MSTRREAREWVVQILFQLDLNSHENCDQVFPEFWKDKKPDRKLREFTENMVRDVRKNMVQIDGLISKFAAHWDLHRMAVIDRNVLRMAICEMMFRDTPHPVLINEAIDIAKYFNSTESGKFVNGILDRVRKELTDTTGNTSKGN